MSQAGGSSNGAVTRDEVYDLYRRARINGQEDLAKSLMEASTVLDLEMMMDLGRRLGILMDDYRIPESRKEDQS